jgi:hypothetical protein
MQARQGVQVSKLCDDFYCDIHCEYLTRFFTYAAVAAAPERRDHVIGRVIAVPNPNAIAVPNPNAILPNPLQAVQIPAVPAANPAAIAPNRIAVFSGVSHSSQRKRRTLEELSGGGGGGGGGGGAAAAVQERNPEAIFATFSEMQRIQNLTAANANIMSILSGVANIPDSDDKQILQTTCIQSLRANTQAMSSPLQNIRAHPPLPFAGGGGLECTICRDPLRMNEQRQGYVNSVFTQCGHGFHIDCLERWKTSASASSTLCPLCRERL